MRELKPINLAPETAWSALDGALRSALPGRFLGLQTYAPAKDGTIGVGLWVDDAATDAEDALLMQTVQIFISTPGEPPVDHSVEARLTALEARVTALESKVQAMTKGV